MTNEFSPEPLVIPLKTLEHDYCAPVGPSIRLRCLSFIEQQKALYRSLTPCFCPAVQTMVRFNSEGINHLLHDRYRPRDLKEQLYRLTLIDHLTEVITKAQKASQKSFVNPSATLWVLEWVEVTDTAGAQHTIRVILRQKEGGRLHFWSVMRRRNSKTA